MANLEEVTQSGSPSIELHNGDEHGEHAKQTFWSKYVFSQDHKMIARQFLITGMIWARYAWGHWWAWDMRLTTFLILWLL